MLRKFCFQLKTMMSLFFLTLLFPQTSLATIQIPAGLSDGEQELVLQILGFGSAFRPVDNPYPLGGYSGVELGLAFENISTGDIGYFGQKASVTTNFTYPRLTMGKGLFSNVDVFFSFMPYNESTSIGIYSGALRWGFFQAT